VPVFRRGVVSFDFAGGNLDAGMGADQLRDIPIGLSLFAESFNFIADHAHEGLDGEALRSQSGGFPQGFLGAQGFVQGIGFWVGSRI
jgi:hypothetical protein